jgi:hypothetical protein
VTFTKVDKRHVRSRPGAHCLNSRFQRALENDGQTSPAHLPPHLLKIDQHRRADALHRLDLDWDELRLGMLRFEAQFLVQRLRPRIHHVAAALVEHRHLTADQIARYATV